MVGVVVIVSIVWLVGYLGFQILDSLNQHGWSDWLRMHSVQITKGCVIWSLKLHVPKLRSWCKTHKQFLRRFFQLGSICGVLACFLVMLGLALTGITIYFIFAACVVTRSIFWRVDTLELASNFPLVASFKRLLLRVANALLFHLVDWLKAETGMAFAESLLLCWVGLLIILPVHELGHAIIAMAEGVEVEKVGLFLSFFIPGMFVTVEDSLDDVHTRCRLRILCAGFWFNLLLCLVSLVFLFLLPLLVTPIFKQQIAVSGFYITEQESNPLFHRLSIGDELMSINHKEVRELDDIKKTVRELVSETFVGICLNKNNFTNSEYFRSFSICCPGLSNDDHNSWPIEDSGYKCFVESSFSNTGYPNAVCISDRWLATQDFALGFCNEERIDDTYFIPYTGTGGRLVSLKRRIPKEGGFNQTLLVITPDALLHSVKWTEYVPRASPLWLYKLLVIWNPIGIIERFFRVLFILSAIVGICNMAPVWRMDGEDVFAWLLIYFPLPMTSYVEYGLRRKRWLRCFTILSILSFPLFFILTDF
ncbi:hypothetical protein GpartN1_g3479.t1 [Galdieria partita]|uniref:Endopeptidase S2P n=1 Tax=Galdieria partita TaxID=83374 RepID=A0A9C7PVK8_9RHOD|nr:hypothetical protein GpartN1_g3479.t1 [Galdieria partita]